MNSHHIIVTLNGNLFPVDDNDDVADCSVNEVAQLNRRSCTTAVSAAANFFIDQDTSAAGLQCNKK